MAPSGRDDDIPSTLPALFLHRVRKTPDHEAYRFPRGDTWASLTWRDLHQQVRLVAAGLRGLGLVDEGRVAILAGTRIAWVVADLAILCAGGATTTIYPSSTADDCAYILADSGSAFVFAEDAAQVAKLQSRRGELGHLRHVITFDDTHTDDPWVMGLDTLMAVGRGVLARDGDLFERTVAAVAKHHLATLIYTSGTTGRPKGVELTHDNWVYEAEAIASVGLLSTSDVQFLWLPLAHSFGKVLSAAQLAIGFRTAIDGRIERIVDNLAAVQPTFVAAVPRIFEKVRAKMLAAVPRHGPKRRIFDWALRVGHRASALRQAGRSPKGLLAWQLSLARKLVFDKLRARFGPNLRFFISGSAPLSRELAEFFHCAEILILEGYGLTESSAASFCARPDAFRFGTVGPPLPGTEVRIAPEDGEILIRSRGIMRGYHNLPAATAEALTSDGWLRTGDIGELDGGLLKITDRKKDLIKTSGGKYVAPQSLESRIKLASPYVGQVLVHGNNRNFCSALVALDAEAIRAWATTVGLDHLEFGDLARHDRVRALIASAIDNVNSQLASFESLKRFAILPVELTIESGDLTPSLKLKRKAVELKYASLLDGFYQGSKPD